MSDDTRERKRPPSTLGKMMLVTVGIGAGMVMHFGAASGSAVRYCEYNGCDLSSGNCDLTDVPLNCQETSAVEGCVSSGC